MKTLVSVLATSSIFSVLLIAQNETTSASARAGIDAGNQAWVDGMKTGNVSIILATYVEDAIDCNAKGDCFRGRVEIEQHMKAQLASAGLARSATVRTWGSSQHGNFVYEWGQAEAAFDDGKKVVDKYLTVWERQADGSWKIFRNMVIPDK